MTGLTHRIEPRGEYIAPAVVDQANTALGALLGALAMAMVAALVVAVLGATGGIRATTTVVAAPAPATTEAMPAAMPGMDHGAAAAAPATTALSAAKPVTAKAIARSATTVPASITRTGPATVRAELQTQEVVAEIQPGETYTYWTFNGTVPGPMIRARVGDTVEIHVANAAGSAWPHSIDLHAVNGPGGGATATQTTPGKDTSFTFKALNPGLYVYHCASAPIPMHIANGMYGMILIEPPGGFSQVDRELYIMQGELYTSAAIGTKGHHEFNPQKLDAEEPDYVVMNGSAGALTGDNAITAKVGETVRLYFGVGGFLPSSLHLIGEIFDRVYPEGGGTVNTNVQTTFVPAGGATMVEFKFDVPGTYTLVDHSLGRALDKGAVAQIKVTGPEDPSIYSGPMSGAGH